MATSKTLLLKKLDLTNYKGFERFSITFPETAYLVGPNNAGKSTIIQALRGCAHMLDHARAKSPAITRMDEGSIVQAYAFTRDDFSLVTENVRHEFSPAEARIELTFSNSNILRVIWPKSEGDDGDDAPFFYLSLASGAQPTRPKEVIAAYPNIGVIPTLTPIEAREEVITEEHLRRHVDTRLSSRHFRNHVYRLSPNGGGDVDLYDEFRTLVARWTPEIELKDVVHQIRELDLYFREALSRTDKEIFWAGDGLQIWLQFLLHIFRLRERQVIVLDEPDVYLHADLQRRLVRILEETAAQTITATHSAEILGESAPSTVVWVDRTRRRAVRAPASDQLARLSDAIGSQFNLRLARALRARSVVFFEGQDLKILRHIARRVGAVHLADEHHVAVIQLKSFSNWGNVLPFKWLIDDLLEKAVPVFVVLDRDYRSQAELDEILAELGVLGIQATIWGRKELESYLLEIPALQRATGAPSAWLTKQLDDIVASMKHFVLSRVHERCVRREVGAKSHLVSVTQRVAEDFDVTWELPGTRLLMCPPKDILSALNQRLSKAGYRPTSFEALARQITVDEVAHEVVGLLRRIESSASRESAR